jgi:hypothetical protein
LRGGLSLSQPSLGVTKRLPVSEKTVMSDAGVPEANMKQSDKGSAGQKEKNDVR